MIQNNLSLFTDKLLKNFQTEYQCARTAPDDIEKMTKCRGSYILLLYNNSQQIITVGKLGDFNIRKGIYLYTGSAFGPGGLKSRVSRHAETDKKLKWHIDYLRKKLFLFDVIFSTYNSKLECSWAETLAELNFTAPFKGFGSSDCKCFSHLFFSELI
jgi:Uri superfamily endonuclease